MRKIFLILMMTGLAGMYSCDVFLQKPDTTGTVDLDAIYSSTKNAEAALMSCYNNSLIVGWPGGVRLSHGTDANICDELARGSNWHEVYTVVSSGLTPANGGTVSYDNNWSCIRAAFLVKENIDKVPDMSDQMKGYYKAEATGLIAYRYVSMFIRLGGVPIVRKSFEATDDLMIPRASLQETLNYIVELCDEAYNGLPEGDWEAGMTGRLTRGAVLAMKAQALMFAARPLFNRATPYLDNGSNNNLICFGSEDPQRWQDAIQANEAVLTWANANGYTLINTGGAGEGQPNPNAFEDYATATSTPSNREVLLAYKASSTSRFPGSELGRYTLMNKTLLPWFSPYPYDTDEMGILTNHFEKYYKADGTDQDWPKVGESQPRDISDWVTRINEMEPRLWADCFVPGYDAKNNEGNSYWAADGFGRSASNIGSTENIFPGSHHTGHGCAQSTKFFYKAGTRLWFEPPLYRLAEIYLNLAEAYNEVDQPEKALQNLNKVHNRAGLPSITERDQTALRKIIQREKAIEFFHEHRRYFEVKHWMVEDIADGVIGGQKREFQFQTIPNPEGTTNFLSNLASYWDANTYIGFWHPKMYLEPFPQSEINKGVITQNPGY